MTSQPRKPWRFLKNPGSTPGTREREHGRSLLRSAVRPGGKEEKVSRNKLALSQYVIAAVFVILLAGLYRLQVVGADNYRVLAQANRIRKIPMLAPRGRLFDREGRLIVDNYPSVSAYLQRDQIHPENLPLIAQGLHMPLDQLETTLHRYGPANNPKYQSVLLKQDITPDEQAFIEAHRNELPELETRDEQRRLYPRDGFAAHLVGYVGEVSEQMLNDPRYAFYESGDVVGRSGVEQTYDSLLRGKDGSRDIIVNSHGKELGELGITPAVPGQDLKLTIDLDVQRAAEAAMEGKIGAMIALDPHTGEVLALVSRPTFDPNQFSVRLTRSYWSEILNNPDHPLLDKATQAQLAPGSTFKVIMSVAGLEEHAAQTMKVNCPGGASFYGHYFKCDRVHGNVDIYHAIPWSCDTFYYTLANRLGIDTIARYATELGFGQRTGIDLPEEAAGTMPSSAWKMKNFHEKWYAGETISVGIGQGAIAATPLQLARAIGGVASGGALRRPHLVFPDEVPPEMVEALHETFPGSGDRTVPMSTETWQIVTDAMAETTRTGTAAASHLEGVDFAGKTGTAQVVSHDALARMGKSHRTVPNSWFVGLAPRRNPDIVVTVLWENGDWGSNSAKLAARVINSYVEKQRRKAGNLVKVAANEPAASTPAHPAAPGGSPTAGTRSPSGTVTP